MSTSIKYDGKSKSISIKHFEGIGDDAKKEARHYLISWTIMKKLEKSGGDDIDKLDLTKNERTTYTTIGDELVRLAAGSLKEYIARRRMSLNTSTTDTVNVTDASSIAVDGCVDTSGAECVATPAIAYEKFKLEIPDLEETGFTTVLFGSSKSGKTTLMKEIVKLPQIAEPDVIKFLISPSINAKIYKDIDKKIIRMDRWRDELVHGLERVQKKTKNKYTFLLIIDDCVLNKNSGKIMQLFCTMRNIKVSTIMLLQSTTLLNRNSRFNSNNIIFKKCNVGEGVEQIMDWFLKSYPPFDKLDKNAQQQMYREICNDYGFINLDLLNGTMQMCKD
jgi:hypothetical protein